MCSDSTRCGASCKRQLVLVPMVNPVPDLPARPCLSSSPPVCARLHRRPGAVAGVYRHPRRFPAATSATRSSRCSPRPSSTPPTARWRGCARVKEVLPDVDGARIDDIVDYLTFVFLPMLLIFRDGRATAGRRAARWSRWCSCEQRVRLRRRRRQDRRSLLHRLPVLLEHRRALPVCCSRRRRPSTPDPAGRAERADLRPDRLRLSVAHADAARADAWRSAGLWGIAGRLHHLAAGRRRRAGWRSSRWRFPSTTPCSRSCCTPAPAARASRDRARPRTPRPDHRRRSYFTPRRGHGDRRRLVDAAGLGRLQAAARRRRHVVLCRRRPRLVPDGRAAARRAARRRSRPTCSTPSSPSRITASTTISGSIRSGSAARSGATSAARTPGGRQHADAAARAHAVPLEQADARRARRRKRCSRCCSSRS